MLRQFLAITLSAAAGFASQANAGMEGGHFEGQLQYADGTSSSFVSADFYNFGQFVETNDDDGMKVGRNGTYSEVDLFVVSFWTGQYNGVDNYEVAGICLFSVFSLYIVNQTDGDDDYRGIVIRNGDAWPMIY